MKNRFKTLFVSIYLIFRRRKFDRRINIISRKVKSSYAWSDGDLLMRFKELWSPLTVHLNKKWFLHFCDSTGSKDERFVPPDLYYIHLEPALNNYKLLKAYADKNFYDIYYPDIKKPAIFVRCIDGFFFDRNYQRIPEQLVNSSLIDKKLFDDDAVDLIVKPAVDSGLGRKVNSLTLKESKLHRSDNTCLSLSDLCRIYRGDFVIQEYIVQHPITAQFNPSTLNSIRVYTYRSFRNEEIIILHCMQRIGSPGGLIDDSFSISIDQEGNYDTRCFDNAGRNYSSMSGLALAPAIKFPFIDELKAVACKVAEKNIHARVLGIDLVVDQHGSIMLMEVNNQSIGIYKTQLTGGPLFKDYTEEVINFCKIQKRTFSFYVDH